jgi:hypothetical protein
LFELIEIIQYWLVTQQLKGPYKPEGHADTKK